MHSQAYQRRSWNTKGRSRTGRSFRGTWTVRCQDTSCQRTKLNNARTSSPIFFIQPQSRTPNAKGLCQNNGVGIYKRLICTSRHCSSKRDLVTCWDWGMQMGLTCCPATSVRNYHKQLRNKPSRVQLPSISLWKPGITQKPSLKREVQNSSHVVLLSCYIVFIVTH